MISQHQTLLTTTTSLVNVEKRIMLPIKSSSIRCIVWARSHVGRFGNRMFMVASAYGLARLHSCHLYLPPSILIEIRTVFVLDIQPFLLSALMFNSIRREVSNPMKIITRDIGCQYIPEITPPNAIPKGFIFKMTGYWQTYLYFDKVRDELRNHVFVAKQSILEKVSRLFIAIYEKKFDFTPHFSFKNHQTFKKQLVQLNGTTWIGIHVRRADFVSLKFSSSDEYLFSAIEYYTRRYADAHFLVISDDKQYCKRLFRNRRNIFVTPRSFSMSDDLITLSLCEHSIITGGTFGWWAAYLAGGDVVHDTVYQTGCEKDEHYYPLWFRSVVHVQKHRNISS